VPLPSGQSSQPPQDAYRESDFMAVMTATTRRMRTSARRNPSTSTVAPTIGTAVAGTTARAAAGTVTIGSRPHSINAACRVLQRAEISSAPGAVRQGGSRAIREEGAVVADLVSLPVRIAS
jgi:hypothetical protein